MSESYNGLSPAQLERLAFLSEELGEAQQAVGKILRHGYHNWNPDVVGSATNKEDLETELGHVACAISMLSDAQDVDPGVIWERSEVKAKKVHKYLHHQEPVEAD